jgi:Ti-type conjugative transfer relaxase TraA
MAVQQVSGKAFTVGQGRSAVAASAYRGGRKLTNERTGEIFDFTVKGENNVEHSEVMLPTGTDPRFYDPETLWNAAERAEQDRDGNWKKLEYNEDGSIKKGPCIARELLICFPEQFAGPEHKETRLAMARQYAAYLIDNCKVAVEISLHEPGVSGDQRNYHCHVQYSDRRIEAQGFEHPTKRYKTGPDAGKPWASEKVTELKFNGHGREPEAFIAAKAAWSNITSMALEKSGHHIEAKRWEHAHQTKKEQGERALERGDIEYFQECQKKPGLHMGPAAMAMEREFATGDGRGLLTDKGDVNRGFSQEDQDKLAERRAEWIKIMQDPKYLVDLVSERKSVFDHADLGRAFFERCETETDLTFFQNVMAKAKADPRLVQLTEETIIEGRRTAARFSAVDMLAREQRNVALAKEMKATQLHKVDPAIVEQVLSKYPTMTDEQRNYVTGVALEGRQLSTLVGDAGTGKSYCQLALKECWEAQGYRVLGTALAAQAGEELESASGIKSGTLQSLLYRLDKGLETLDSNTIVVLDEAAMNGSKQTGRLMDHIVQNGAALGMAGDHKQVEAIEAGTPFRDIVEATGAYELTQGRRQAETWQKDASLEFARGDFKAGMDAYNARGYVHMVEKQDEAIGSLVKMYVDNQGQVNDRGDVKTQIVTTHRNADAKAINEAIREEIKRRDPEKLKDGRQVETYFGQREIAPGDQIQFRRNNKQMDVKNGTIGLVDKIEPGKMTVRVDLDKDGSQGRLVEVNLEKYNKFDHGYAGSIHKGQGASRTTSYTLYSNSNTRALSYVAMTRHKMEVHAFASYEKFKNYDTMVERIGRENVKESTLDYAESAAKLQAKREQERAAEKGAAPVQESTTPVSRLSRDMAFAERREAERKQSALDRVLNQAAGQTKEPKQSALDRALDAKQQAKEPAQQQKKNRGIDI